MMKLITLENLGNGFLIDTSNKKINIQSSSGTATSNNDIDVDFKLHFTTSTTLKVDVTEQIQPLNGYYSFKFSGLRMKISALNKDAFIHSSQMQTVNQSFLKYENGIFHNKGMYRGVPLFQIQTQMSNDGDIQNAGILGLSLTPNQYNYAQKPFDWTFSATLQNVSPMPDLITLRMTFVKFHSKDLEFLELPDYGAQILAEYAKVQNITNVMKSWVNANPTHPKSANVREFIENVEPLGQSIPTYTQPPYNQPPYVDSIINNIKLYIKNGKKLLAEIGA